MQNENQSFKMTLEIFMFRLYLQNHDHKNENKVDTETFLTSF